MQGVSVIKRGKDACRWADVLFFCCSYAECRQFLNSPGVCQAVSGKYVVLLSNGTPEDAQLMAIEFKSMHVSYLDAFVLVRNKIVEISVEH